MQVAHCRMCYPPRSVQRSMENNGISRFSTLKTTTSRETQLASRIDVPEPFRYHLGKVKSFRRFSHLALTMTVRPHGRVTRLGPFREADVHSSVSDAVGGLRQCINFPTKGFIFIGQSAASEKLQNHLAPCGETAFIDKRLSLLP